MKQTYMYEADMGSIMLESNGVRFYFNNGWGDGRFTVTIIDQDLDASDMEYVGHFDVLDGGKANLHSYDCGGDVIHTFTKGRYPVYRDNNGHMTIGKWK